ncbi:hypothetical protein RRG08_009174 [Elysia crispata]|uniref:Uncharacterized protein n=1 Tax=Elysia crispata TaxID=231223 RepID=A0AAE0ZQ92_9GAST|nr:hypothetical protein RRG08_009174 [Elysia crispata]
MALQCSVVQLCSCTLSTSPRNQAIGSALGVQNVVTVPQNPDVCEEIPVTYQCSTKISKMEKCWYKGISVEAFGKHSVSKRKDDNTFDFQFGQGDSRGSQSSTKMTGMETVGLKAQLQSNLLENIQYQKLQPKSILFLFNVM